MRPSAARPTELHLIGAPFQIKVWEALLAIPTGHVTTYADIAGAIGHPTAHRAVGTAVGRNPISFLIPCHRALRRDGGLGGYHWGLAAQARDAGMGGGAHRSVMRESLPTARQGAVRAGLSSLV
jgi:O-6-methylguanine DNA methyltransferase